MKLNDLQEIAFELKRFLDVIEEAKLLAKNTIGYVSSYDGETMGKHDISGTRMSGAVKRKALDLKYFLTQKLK